VQQFHQWLADGWEGKNVPYEIEWSIAPVNGTMMIGAD
jgi:hypothetical protein